MVMIKEEDMIEEREEEIEYIDEIEEGKKI